ncbi:T9SS type A sorting domain-containing protein [bacterium]|nr:T9SS type A sorting domain-containing protein [bacterium]
MFMRILFSLISFLTISSILFAQENIALVGECDVPGNPRSLRVVGQYVYITASGVGTEFSIVDVSNPEDPFLVSTTALGAYVSDVDIYDDYAYIADFLNTVVVVDISDPEFPEVAGEEIDFTIGVETNAVLVTDQILIAGGLGHFHNDCGFSLLSLAHPDDPILLGEQFMHIENRTYTIRGLTASESLLLVSYFDGGLWAYDISDPSSPLYLSEIHDPESAWDTAIYENWVFAACDDDIALIDYTDPEAPQVVQSLDYLPTRAVSVALSWPYGILAARGSGVRVLDLQSDNGMQEVGYYDLMNAYDVEVKGDLIYATDHRGRLLILDWNAAQRDEADQDTLIITVQPFRHELISTSIMPQNFDASVVFGGLEHLLIAYEDNGDIFIPNFINSIGDIDVSEGYDLICNEADTLVIVGEQLSEDWPYHLTANRWNWMGFPFHSPINEMAVDDAMFGVEDNLAIIMTDDGDVWIPNFVNTIGNMHEGVGYYVFPLTTFDFVYPDIFGFFTTASQMDEVEDELVNQTNMHQNTSGLPYAILLNFDTNLQSLQPFTVTAFDGDLEVGQLYVDSGSSLGCLIAWAGDPKHHIEGFVNGNPISLKLHNSVGERIYLELNPAAPCFGEGPYAEINLASAQGVTHIVPNELTIGEIYPNPFNSTFIVPLYLPVSSRVDISVYNLLGRNVYENHRFVAAGNQTLEIDMERENSKLPSGVYLLTIGASQRIQTEKIVFLK